MTDLVERVATKVMGWELRSRMTDAEIAADMNTVYRERDLSSLTGDEIFNAADPAGYAGLSNADKQLFLAICSRNAINPFGANNVQAMIPIFGAGTTTLSNLAALRKE
jgi:hypothetical protein